MELKPSREVRIYAMGRKRFLHITKSNVGHSGKFTCDAGDVATSCTVEVYGKVKHLNVVKDKGPGVALTDKLSLSLCYGRA